MAAKLLHSLADENPDLQKQIGCMTGIFQIFDRQHFVTGRRPNQRRLLPPPSGNAKFSNGNLDAQRSQSQDAMEKNSIKYVNEKRASTESSRASFSSSSRSSSFSSLDCGKVGQPDPTNTDRVFFHETPSSDPVISHTSASPSTGRLSVDLRDVVKDSMYRDSRGLSVHTMVKDKASGHISRYEDSPRPLQLSKSVNGLSRVAPKEHKQDAVTDIKESLRVLARLHDNTPQYDNEKQPPRLSFESKEDSSFSVGKDARRFSYDGRDHVQRKIKNLPRLSLDSRESSARSNIIDSKLNHPSGSMQGDIKYSNERVANVSQPSRPSSVVAKLMGLDLLPDTNPSNESDLGQFPIENRNHSSMSLGVQDVCRSVRLPKSPRSSKKEPNSPRWRNSDMKPVSSSKIPIEPAPWKHTDSARTSPKQASKKVNSSSTTLNTSPSVYGEIEKHLKDIEFQQSGKDLRALKQILEAMQAKGYLEGTREEQSSNIVNNRDNDRNFGSGLRDGMNSNDLHTTRGFSSKLRGNSGSTTSDFPIVIMKPAKFVQKSSIPPSSVIPSDCFPGLQGPHAGEAAAHHKNSASSIILRDQTVRDSHKDQATTSGDKRTNNRFQRVTQTSPRSSHSRVAKDNSMNSSVKSSGSTSPRLLQKKLEFDKQSHPPTPSSDSSKSRRQPNRQTTDSSSPGVRRRPKSSSVVPNDDGSNEKCNELRSVSLQEDNTTVQSGTYLPSESGIEIEVNSTEQPFEMTNCQSPAPEGFECFTSETSKSDANLRLSEDNITGDVGIAPEQPSPVSVLDSSVYMEDSPSPVKQTSHAIQDERDTESTDMPGDDFSDAVDDLSNNTTVLKLPSEINRKKLQSIDDLVQKLRRLNSTHDEGQTDYIALLCDNTNPDHRYISEILLASGLLLRDLSSGLSAFHLHPSGLPINPELFFVLEQTKASSLLAKGENVIGDIAITKSKPEKFHRKLIFDTVNEILVGKLALVSPPTEPWLKPEKLARKSINAQKLLRELCAEIELLQTKEQDVSLEEEEDGLKTILWEDVMHRSDNWTNFQGEVSRIILDIERSIFKELVNEIIIGEAAAHRGRPSRRCRQLFSK